MMEALDAEGTNTLRIPIRFPRRTIRSRQYRSLDILSYGRERLFD